MVGKRLTPSQVNEILAVRRRARTDLLYLTKYILDYDKVDEHVHGGIASACQSFRSSQGRDYVTPEGVFYYEPMQRDPLFLAGARRRLFLDARWHYKTTIQTISHGIQWILNFPDIWLLMVHQSLEQGVEKYSEMRDKFRYCKNLRYFFPEYCPAKGIERWGTDMEFTVPNRQVVSGTPTVTVASLEKVKQGSHYHVIKFFDIVGEENSGTPEQIKKTIKKFGLFRNLLVSPKYWMDVEGTRYHFDDCYGSILEAYEDRKKRLAEGKPQPQDREPHQQWSFYVRGCYEKDLVGPPTYQPEELDAPYKLDAEGHPIPVFPEINSYYDLEAMRNDPTYGDELFCAQMLNNPTGSSETMTFPLKYLQWTPARHVMTIPGVWEMTIDTAHTIGDASNDSVLTAAKWSRTNRCYVAEIRIGKFLPDDLLLQIFEMYLRYKPQKVKIEESMFLAGLQPSISRMSDKLNVWPNWVMLKRDTGTRKKDRIRLTLQPWYKARLLYFSDGLSLYAKERLKNELTRFPKYTKDDVLDTVADLFADREFFGVDKKAEESEESEEARDKRKTHELATWMEKKRKEMIFGPPDDTQAQVYEEGTGL